MANPQWTVKQFTINRDGSQDVACMDVSHFTWHDPVTNTNHHAVIKCYVRSNSYRHQCEAYAERWNGERGWLPIARLLTGDITAPTSLYVMSDDEVKNIRKLASHFATDLHALRSMVESVLTR